MAGVREVIAKDDRPRIEIDLAVAAKEIARDFSNAILVEQRLVQTTMLNECFVERLPARSTIIRINEETELAIGERRFFRRAFPFVEERQ